MKRRVAILVIIIAVCATAAWAETLQSYSCCGDGLRITVAGGGDLTGSEARTWLFKYGYLRYADHATRKYTYTCPPSDAIMQCDLESTPKFARWSKDLGLKAVMRSADDR
jgi:hypothetical protein